MVNKDVANDSANCVTDIAAKSSAVTFALAISFIAGDECKIYILHKIPSTLCINYKLSRHLRVRVPKRDTSPSNTSKNLLKFFLVFAEVNVFFRENLHRDSIFPTNS